MKLYRKAWLRAMKRKDNLLLIGGTLTGMSVVMNALAFLSIQNFLTRKQPKIPAGKIESVDEMHVDYLRRKNHAWLKDQTRDKIVIKSHDGLKLRGEYIHNSEANRKEGEPVKVVLLSHGYGGSGFKDMTIFTDFYRRQGYDILLFDQRSHGKSEGSAITMGALEQEDIARWVDYIIRKNKENCKILLHGWSMGAAAVYLAAANGLPSQVKGVVFDCGYDMVEAQFMHTAKKLVILPKTLCFYILQFMRPWTKFLCGFSMWEASPIYVSRYMKLPILFVHGKEDTVVPFKMGYRLYEASDKTPYRDFLAVKDADHTYSYIRQKGAYEAALLKLMDACMN